MQVVVKRSALISALKSIVLENRTSESGRLDDIMADIVTDQDPIKPTEQMSTQLSADMPDVGDPDFIPTTIEQLSRSAYVISNAVPEDEIEWFYRKLHEILDEALDNSSLVEEDEEEVVADINESVVNKIVSLLIEQDDVWTDDEVDKIEVAKEMVQEYLESINFGYEERERAVEDGVLNIPFWESIMKLALDDTIGPKSLDSKIAEIISDLTEEQADRVLDDIRSEWMKRARSPTSMDSNQISVNQVLAKELDELLKSHSYNDIIEIYTERLSDSSKSPKWLKDRLSTPAGNLWKSGMIDMISIVKVRKWDPKKRERTDFSVKSGEFRERESSDDEGSQQITPEQRMKTLEALAPLFGFKNASGLRQWYMKFPEAIFKAVGRSEGGMDAFKGYSEEVFESMSALLDSLSDVVAKLVEGVEEDVEENPQDTELAKVLSVLERVDQDLVTMREKRDDHEDEELDVDMLLGTLGGKVLRHSFRSLFYKQEFIDYAREMKKHMIGALQSLGLDAKISNAFAKMFNGEVELQLYNSDKSQMKKIRRGGLTDEMYRSALKEAESFNKEFFGGKRIKDLRKRFGSLTRDEEKLAKSVFESIPEIAEWEKIERENPQLQVNESDLVEKEIRKIISGMV